MRQQLMFKLDQSPSGRGLRCDGEGLFLGSNALLQRDAIGNFEARTASDLRKTFVGTYGNDAIWDGRIRSVKVVADALNNGDMARAMMAAVLMRLPDPDGAVRISDVDGVLAKAGFNPGEPRDERGRWTTGGASSETDIADHRYDARSADVTRRPADVQLADAYLSDASDDPIAEAVRAAARQVRETHESPEALSDFSSERQIFNPSNTPHTILAAAEGDEEKDSRFGISGNYPPEELIPERLQQSPAGRAIQFFDNMFDIAGPAKELSLEVAEDQKRALFQRIRQIDPSYVYQGLEPAGGLAGMSSEARTSVINGLQADLAAAIYRMRGDIRPLQEVTLEFMQRTANAAYEEGVQRYDAGRLSVRLSREEAIGNFVDGMVRTRLRTFFGDLGIQTGSGSPIQVNVRAYISSGADASYRIPDARVGNLAFDTSVTAKLTSVPQVRGFFNADFQPAGVVIVRPNQLGNNSSYVLWRPKGW
jgi:hypothetical protein